MRAWRLWFRNFAQISGAVFGAGVYGLSQWGVLVVLARYDSAESVGAFSYALAVTAPIALFFGLSIRQALVTEPADARTLIAYIRLRLVTILALEVVVVTLAFVARSADLVLFAVGTAKALDLFGDLVLAPVQKNGRLVPIGIAQALNGLVTVGLVFLLIELGVSANVALAASIVGSLIGLGYSLHASLGEAPDIHRALSLALQWKDVSNVDAGLQVWRLLLKLSPLGFAAAVGSLRTGLPRYVLESSWGLAEVGYFSAVVYFVVAGNMFVSAVAQFNLPQFVQIVEKSGGRATIPKLRRLMLKWAAIGLAAVVGAYYGGEELLAWLYGSDYGSRELIVVLAIGWAINTVATMCDTVLIALREFKQQLYVNTFAAIATALACLAIVPNQGAIGAGWATAISALAVLGFRALALVMVYGRAIGR